MGVSETRAPIGGRALHRIAWFVGPLAATGALVAISLVWLELFASGGGLLIAAGVAFWIGWVAAAYVEPERQWRHAVIVAAYVVALMVGFLAWTQSQPPPPGTSRGGASVEPPR